MAADHQPVATEGLSVRCSGVPGLIPSGSCIQNMAGILGGLLFSTIGFFVLRYGRSTSRVGPMVIGVLLMVYPYFVPNAIIIYLLGIGLLAALFFFRD